MDKLLVGNILDFYDGYIVIKRNGEQIADTRETNGDISFIAYGFEVAKIEATEKGVITLIVK